MSGAGKLVPLVLVPVEPFTGLCDHGDCPNPDHLGYGISDAVSAWSDCNRAAGRIYRVDESPSYRQPGECVTVYVPESSLPFFGRVFGDATHEPSQVQYAERVLPELLQAARDHEVRPVRDSEGNTE